MCVPNNDAKGGFDLCGKSHRDCEVMSDLTAIAADGNY